MVALNTLIENQYHTPGLYEDILKRLGDQEIELSNVSRGDIGGVDEFHVRGAEVSRELACRIKLDHSRVMHACHTGLHAFRVSFCNQCRMGVHGWGSQSVVDS